QRAIDGLSSTPGTKQYMLDRTISAYHTMALAMLQRKSKTLRDAMTVAVQASRAALSSSKNGRELRIQRNNQREQLESLTKTFGIDLNQANPASAPSI